MQEHKVDTTDSASFRTLDHRASQASSVVVDALVLVVVVDLVVEVDLAVAKVTVVRVTALLTAALTVTVRG